MFILFRKTIVATLNLLQHNSKPVLQNLLTALSCR